jgi:tetratricopeptide (TPR) repeat protein
LAIVLHGILSFCLGTQAIAQDKGSSGEDPKRETASPASITPEGYDQEALGYTRIGDYTKAIAVLTHALEQQPKAVSLLLQRGNVYLQMAAAEQRIKDCTDEISENPDTIAPYLHRGFAYYNIGDYDQAISDYTTVLARRPQYAAAYLGRGLAYVAQGKLAEGISDYEQAFALRPGMRPSHRLNLFQASYRLL